jgi:hypothetical protein
MYADLVNAGSVNRLTFSNSSCGKTGTGGTFRKVAPKRVTYLPDRSRIASVSASSMPT